MPLLKHHCLRAFFLCVGGLLVACQAPPSSNGKETACLPGEVKQKNKCVRVSGNDGAAVSNRKKKYYGATFKLDPHARHKQSKRIVIPGTIKTAQGINSARPSNVPKRNGEEKVVERVATFSVNNPDYKFRNYAQSVISPSEHSPRVVRYQEKSGYPRVRSGNLQFDGLFALANEEVRARFITRTSDKRYRNAEPLACDCYGDPKSAHFIMPSHLALAGHLGLAMMTPERMKNSLLFQLSPYRKDVVKPVSVPGDKNGLQIVQRAGRFGAWPVYSSRVLWSLAAQSVLTNLPDEQRFAFSKTAYHAMTNIIEIDRDSIFDGSDGLYFGGHDLQPVPMKVKGIELAMVKSLVVNAVYFRALLFASDLAATQNDVATSVKYLDWALDLKNAINHHFWDSELGVYRSFLSNNLGALLGSDIHNSYALWEQSLVLELGIAETLQRARIDEYGPAGNSPFSNAFSLRAAVRQKNVAVANLVYDSVFHHASQKLTHFSEGSAGIEGDDLVSVSTYFSSVIDGVFGIQTSEKGLSFDPFVTAKLRRERFDSQRAIALYDIALRGKTFNIKIILPRATSKLGYYDIANIKVNGKRHILDTIKNEGHDQKRSGLKHSTANEIKWSALSQKNTVIITLGKLKSGNHKIREFPRPPEQSQSVSAIKTSSSFSVPVDGGRKLIKSWGAAREKLTVKNVNIAVAGRYAIQWEYRMDGKAAKQVLGIHNAVKRMKLTDANNNELVDKVVQLPIAAVTNNRNKRAEPDEWSRSTPIIVTLAAGAYRVDLDDFINMTYLKANMTYTGIGGRNGVANRFDVKGLTITPL